MTSIDPARTASSVVVLRSGCTSVSPIGTAASSDRQREALPRRPTRAEHAGEDEQQPELGQLRGLEADGPDPDPPGGTVRGPAHREDGGEEQHGRAVGDPAQDAEQPDADLPEQREREHAAAGDHAPAAAASSSAPVR